METIWTIRMLGGLSVQRTGFEPVRLSIVKPHLLLARLAFDLNTDVSRDVLVEAFWPHVDISRARHSLAEALSSVRHLLEPPGIAPNSILLTDHSCVRLPSAKVTTDLARLRAAIQAAHCAQSPDEYVRIMQTAAALYRGELLPGAFDDWALIDREAISTRFLAELQRFVNTLSERGNFEDALYYALSMVKLSPLDDRYCGQALALLLKRGRVDEARLHYHAFRAAIISAEQRLPRRSLVKLMEPYICDLGASPPDSAAAATHRPLQHEGVGSGGRQVPSAPIPVFPNRFFGRERELAEIEALLQPADNRRIGLLEPGPARLVTITGLGGCGKTRLAVEAMSRLFDQFRGNVLFVPLGGISRPFEIVQAIASALRLDGAVKTPLEEIGTWLCGGRWLLVLDACERVPSCSKVVMRLLSEAPNLQIMAVSRRPLRASGEHIVIVHPLAVPTEVTGPEALCEFPSVQLFAARAQEVRRDFRITERNSEYVSQIIGRLAGVPLAIELAASHARSLSSSQMLSELNSSFEGMMRLSPNSLQAGALVRAIAWSYNALTPGSAELFGALSIFRDGFTVEAVRTITGSQAVLESMDEITGLSLIESDCSDETVRFSMLGSLREFADARLDSAARAKLTGRHASYYLGVLNGQAPLLRSSLQSSAISVLDAESANIQAAIQYSDGTAVETCLAAAGWRYWYLKGRYRYGADVILRAIRSGAKGLPEYAEALHGLGVLLDMQDDNAAAVAALRESLELTNGKMELALAYARTLNSLALHLDKRGAHSESAEACRRALFILREVGDPWDIAGCLNTLGKQHWSSRDRDAAEACFREALALFAGLHDWSTAAAIHNNLGCIAWDIGDMASARTSFEYCLAIFRELKQPARVAYALQNLGDTIGRQGDVQNARQLLLECLTIRDSLGDHYGTAAALEALAHVEHIAGMCVHAVHLEAAASEVRIRFDVPVKPGRADVIEADLLQLRESMSERDFDAAWRFGSLLNLNALVLFAREGRLVPDLS